MYDGDIDNIIDNSNGELIYPFDKVKPLCDLLNELNDKNEELKKELRKKLTDELTDMTKIQNQLKEGLKNTEELLVLTNKYERLKKEYVAVRQQNSRLKQAVSGYEDTAKVANRLTRELEKNNMKVLAVKRKGDLL